MRVRISYTVDVSDAIREQINAWYGRPGLANREEIKRWYISNGESMDDDLNDAADRGEDANMGRA